MSECSHDSACEGHSRPTPLSSPLQRFRKLFFCLLPRASFLRSFLNVSCWALWICLSKTPFRPWCFSCLQQALSHSLRRQWLWASSWALFAMRSHALFHCLSGFARASRLAPKPGWCFSASTLGRGFSCLLASKLASWSGWLFLAKPENSHFHLVHGSSKTRMADRAGAPEIYIFAHPNYWAGFPDWVRCFCVSFSIIQTTFKIQNQ